MKGNEERDALFGRLFGFLAIARSGRLALKEKEKEKEKKKKKGKEKEKEREEEEGKWEEVKRYWNFCVYFVNYFICISVFQIQILFFVFLVILIFGYSILSLRVCIIFG